MIDKNSIRDEIWSILFLILVVVLTVIIVMLINFVGNEEEVRSDIVGGVFIDSIDDHGWNENQYEGLSDACYQYGMDLEIVTGVKENKKQCKKAVDELAEKGATVIFLTSDGFGNNIKEVVQSYPNIQFYTVSPEAGASNIKTYYGRMYQMRYLAGMYAGCVTKSNVLGFVAAMDNPQVDRCINAYSMGARSVNPNAVVKVRYIGSWSDQQAEKEASKELVEIEHADILTNHSSNSVTTEYAESNGVYSIGYNTTSAGRSDRFLCNLVFHWEALYRRIIHDYLRGSRTNDYAYWLDFSDGVVGIENISPLLDKEIKAQVKSTQSSFGRGNDVFLGEIRKNDGTVMCRKNERISDNALLFDMNWLVEGVE